MSSITMHSPRLARASTAVERAPATLTPCECCGGTRHERIASKRGYPLRRCRNDEYRQRCSRAVTARLAEA